MALTRDLCGINQGSFVTGMQKLFRRIGQELPLDIFKYRQAKNTTDGLYQITGPCKKPVYISMAS